MEGPALGSPGLVLGRYPRLCWGEGALLQKQWMVVGFRWLVAALAVAASAAEAGQLQQTLQHFWDMGVESVEPTPFNYARNGMNWGGTCVNGTRQSPIALTSDMDDVCVGVKKGGGGGGKARADQSPLTTFFVHCD